jgi:glycosyltransferase involved in cell wall biosynthesis
MTTMIRSEFSVVITAYNKGAFIVQAIESILSQTFGDLEVIVIDDGSTDGTASAVAAINDPRVKYHYQENSGLPAIARNTGIKLSSGKYIVLLDGDDYANSDKLARCKEVLDRERDADLVCHNLAVVYNGKTLRTTDFGPGEDDMYSKLLFYGNCLGPSAVAIRREVFFEDGLWFSEDKDLRAIEDYEYWIRLSMRHKFYFIPDVLGYYRVSDSGIYLGSIEPNTSNMLKLLDSHFAAMENKSLFCRIGIRKRRSQVMSAAGRMYSHKREFGHARRWYLKALAEYPMNYKAAICYITALAGLRLTYN